MTDLDDYCLGNILGSVFRYCRTMSNLVHLYVMPLSDTDTALPAIAGMCLGKQCNRGHLKFAILKFAE